MASFDLSCSNGYIHLWCEWSESSVDTANNTSVVHVAIYGQRTNSGYTTYGTANTTVNVGGTSQSENGLGFTITENSATLLFAKNYTIAHNTDGSKSVTISVSVSTDVFTGSGSGTATLTTIARYANLTSLSVKSRTVNSITLSYTTDKSAWLFVKLNNGEWLNGGEPFKSNTTSGEFTIYYKDRASTQRLDVNTTYSITVLCRALNRDSEIDTQKTISATTYDIAKISSASSFEHGNNASLSITNPSRCFCKFGYENRKYSNTKQNCFNWN